MESLGEKTRSTKGFLKYVFNLNEDSKGELFNLIQYVMLSIIPIVLLNKGIQRFIPEADEEKGSLEITAEIIIQLCVMFIGLFFINRIVVYIPTYSGQQYPKYEVIFSILSMLMLLASLQTKVGEKINIIIDRIMELWDGKMGNSQDKKEKFKNKGKNQQVKVSQPISQNMVMPTPTVNQFSDGTSLGQLPNYNMSSSTSMEGMSNNQTMTMTNSNSNSNSNTNSSSMNTPSFGDTSEGTGIMAANEVLGGAGMFSSW